MKKLTEQYENNLKKDLLDPVEAAEYLNSALEDGSQEVFNGFERRCRRKGYF